MRDCTIYVAVSFEKTLVGAHLGGHDTIIVCRLSPPVPKSKLPTSITLRNAVCRRLFSPSLEDIKNEHPLPHEDALIPVHVR